MKYTKTHNKTTRILSVILCFLLTFSLSSCGEKDEDSKPAQYGTYGADFALNLAKSFPYREAFSAGEQGAGIMIKNELESLGY